MPDWWQTVFDEGYMQLYRPTLTPERTQKEANFVVKTLGLKPGDDILDLACGFGRHSIELAKRGLSVTGLDYSQYMIDLAKSEAKKARVKIDFQTGDMRDLPFENRFDTALLLFTSFGYLGETDDKQALRQIHKALKPGGRFLIDVRNGDEFADSFSRGGDEISPGIRRHDFPPNREGDLSYQETLTFHTGTCIIHNRTIWNTGGADRVLEYDIKVYTAEQLKQLLIEAGLTVMQAWGDFDGSEFDPAASKRCIFLTQKN